MAEIKTLTPSQIVSFVRPLIETGTLPRIITGLVRQLGFQNPVRQIQRIIRAVQAQVKAEPKLRAADPGKVIPPELFSPSFRNISQPFGYIVEVNFIDTLTGQPGSRFVEILSSRRLQPQTVFGRVRELVSVEVPGGSPPLEPQQEITGLEIVTVEERTAA